MELHQLRYFVAVAEELHFGRAAKRENVSQPPLSLQIKKLEVELGVILFHRTKRRVALSDAGHALLPNARRILADLTVASDIARKAHRGDVGTVAIGFVHSAAFDYLPRLLGPFRLAFPSVQLSLREMTVSEQMAELARGKIDLGIVRPPVLDNSMKSFVVVSEPFSVVVPATHGLADRREIELREVSDEDFVFYPRHRSPAFHQQLLAMCAEADFVPRTVVEANTMHTAIGLVGTGAGIAIVPNSVRCIRQPSVRFLDVVGCSHKAQLAIVFPHREVSASVVQLLKHATRLADASWPHE